MSKHQDVFEGSIKMADLVREALARGLMRTEFFPESKILSWVNIFNQKKDTLLEREFLEVEELVFFNVVEESLRPDLIEQDIIPLFWHNSFFPLFSMGVSRFGIFKAQRLFLPLDQFTENDLQEFSLVIGIFSSATKQSLFKRIDLARLSKEYWVAAKIWANSHARVTDGKISEASHSLRQWPIAKRYADVNCSPSKYLPTH